MTGLIAPWYTVDRKARNQPFEHKRPQKVQDYKITVITYTTATNSNLDIKFSFVADSELENTYAFVKYYRNGDFICNGDGEAPKNTYNFTEIVCVQSQLKNCVRSGLSGYELNYSDISLATRAIFTHEMGHCFGLAHVEGSLDLPIMDPHIAAYYGKYGLYKPQATDIEGVQVLYGL